MFKNRVSRGLFTFTFVSLLLMAISCSHGAETAKHKRGKEGAASTEPSDWTKVKTPDNQPVAQFKVEGENTRLEFGSNKLTGEQKESGKRKYQDSSGSLVAEVKSDADDFKVRTPDGKLLWKVKVNPEKIKIANNEEMNGALSIETKEADRLKVYRNEQEIGKVRFNRDKGRVKVENSSDATVFDSNSNKLSTMYGVLLMNEIPDNERYIIMVELLARGR